MAKRIPEVAEELSLEDLAYISDVCRYQGFRQELGDQFISAIRPIVIEENDSGRFAEKKNALVTASKLVTAIGNVQKYKEDDPALWHTALQMLKWGLKSQEGEAKLIPMNPFEFSTLVQSLSRQREVDVELWTLLAKVLVTLMNTKKLELLDLMLVTRAMVNAKVRSDKLYGFIVRYFMGLEFSKDLKTVADPSMTIFFYYSLAKAYPTLSKTDDFFERVNTYLQAKMGDLTVK